MQRNNNKPNTQIAFRAREEDREYLRILAAKAHCSQAELLLKLMYTHGETMVETMRLNNWRNDFDRFRRDLADKVASWSGQSIGDVETWLVKEFGWDFELLYRSCGGNVDQAFNDIQNQ